MTRAILFPGQGAQHVDMGREFHDASISPDGRRAAWSQKLPDPDGRERMGAISIAELPGGAPRRLTAATAGSALRLR